MSSSSRFQSHLFNFVSQQTQKLTDKISTGLRHLKIGAIWGTQILLYPVYVLFQSSRLVGRQLQQTMRRVRQLAMFDGSQTAPQTPDSAQLAVDTPIQRVLTAIRGGDAAEPVHKAEQVHKREIQVSFFDRLLALLRFSQGGMARSTSQPLDNSAQTAPLFDAALPLTVSIQGIASLLPTGKLVLVTIDNQIMDVLTWQQQEQLRQRIIWELANYWRFWRQRSLSASPFRLPPIEDRALLLPPVRLLRQLMAWVQTGPVAIAANLFQESDWVVQPAPLVWFTPTLTLPTFDPTRFSPPSMPTRNDFKTLSKKVPTFGEMEALIWAAIRYFFGQGDPKAAANRRLAGADEPWLTSMDVFGNAANLFSGSNKTKPVALPSPTPATLKGQPTAAQIGRTFQPIAHLPAQTNSLQSNSGTLVLPFQPQSNPIWRWVNRSWSALVPPPRRTAKPTAQLIKRQPSHLTQVKPEKIDRSTQTVSHLAPQAAERELTQTASQSIAQPFSEAPDWIDTPATAIGYVKHPLERLLGWLDQSMAWVEKTLIALWNWLFRRQSS